MKKLTLILIVLLLPVVALAQYQPLVSIPLPGGSVSGPGTTFQDYINAVYALSISIAALLAVIKIVIAGVKWMMTDVVTSKGEAKKDIQGALVGLLIVLAAVLIISVINPNITNVVSNGAAPIGGVNGPPAPPAPPPACSVQIGDIISSTAGIPINCVITQCQNNGGQFQYSNSSGNSSTAWLCVNPNQMSVSQYQSILATNGVVDPQLSQLVSDFNSLATISTITDADLGAPMHNTSDPLFAYVNSKRTPAQFTQDVNNLMAQDPTLTTVQAQELAFANVLKSNAVFIHQPGATAGLRATRTSVCTGAGATTYNINDGSGTGHWVCLLP